MFLKDKFGVGYQLRVEVDKSKTDKSKTESVSELVLKKINSAKLERVTSSEMIYSIPQKHTENFPELFKSLDQAIMQKKFGIKSFDILPLTLEDVFFKICQETEENLDEEKPNQGNSFLKQTEYSTSVWNIFFEFFEIRLNNLLHCKSFKIYLLISTLLCGLTYLVVFFSARNSLHNPDPILLKTSLYHNKKILLQNSINLPVKGNKVFEHFINSEEVENLTLTNTKDYIYAIKLYKNEKNKMELALIVNKQYYHSLPILQNAFTNFLISNSLRHLFEITTISHPLPFIEVDFYEYMLYDVEFIILSIIWILSIVPLVVAEVVDDRIVSCTINQIQMIFS